MTQAEQPPVKVKRPRRRQELTAVLVGEIFKSRTPAPIDTVLRAVRDLADAGLIDPQDGLIYEEFSKPRAFRSKKSLNKMRDFGLGKAEIQALREHLSPGDQADSPTGISINGDEEDDGVG